ncbi:unnamed protein product [Natator depressus]
MEYIYLHIYIYSCNAQANPPRLSQSVPPPPQRSGAGAQGIGVSDNPQAGGRHPPPPSQPQAWCGAKVHPEEVKRMVGPGLLGCLPSTRRRVGYSGWGGGAGERTQASGLPALPAGSENSKGGELLS